MKRDKYYMATITFFITLSITVFFIVRIFADDPESSVLRQKVEYKAELLRDPFRSPIVKDIANAGGAKTSEVAQKKAPPLKIQGIIWGGRFNQAIINNKVVKIGDTVEGARIINIDRHRIIVFFEGEQYTLLSPTGRGPAP
jgi:hypothetical protein